MKIKNVEKICEIMDVYMNCLWMEVDKWNKKKGLKD